MANSKFNPDWVDFDLTPLAKYSDFVDVAGSPYVLLFRRADGDVLNHQGDVMGQGAAKLVVSGSTCGYIDAKGNFHAITDGDALDEANPMKTMRKYFNRRLAINQNGDVIGWGGEYKDGSRSVPEPARKKVKQVAMFYETDLALTEDGNLYRWSKKGLLDQPEKFNRTSKKSRFSHTPVLPFRNRTTCII